MNATCTLITATRPTTVTKEFSMQDGALHKLRFPRFFVFRDVGFMLPVSLSVESPSTHRLALHHSSSPTNSPIKPR
jgi:hypothetical protein